MAKHSELYGAHKGGGGGGVPPAGGGDVVGPPSATNENIPLWDGVTGKLLKNSTITKANVESAISLKHSNALDHTQGTDTALGALAPKNPVIDADLVISRDSISSWALVTSTWTQIKAFLKTYFDTLFVSAPASTTENKVPQWNSTTKLLKDGLTVGTAANNLVQLNGDAKLPAVDGSLLTNLPSGGGATSIVKSSDQTTTGAAGFTDVGDFSFSVTAGKTYFIRGVLILSSSNVNNGYHVGFNGPAADRISFDYQYTPSSGGNLISKGIIEYNYSTLLQGSGSLAPMPMTFQGYVTIGTAGGGTFKVLIYNEGYGGNTTTTVHAKSVLQYQQID